MAGSQIPRKPAQYRRCRFAAGGIYCYERLCKCPFILVMVVPLLLVSILVAWDILRAWVMNRSAWKAMSYYLEIASESIFNGELILDAQQFKTSRDMSDKKTPAVNFSAAVSND